MKFMPNEISKFLGVKVLKEWITTVNDIAPDSGQVPRHDGRLTSHGITMKTYPIHVGRSNYRGSDPKKRAKAMAHNRDAELLESRANTLLQNQTEPVRTYLWMELATATGLSYDRVAELGYSIDGGSGGFRAANKTDQRTDHR
ncbi:hypothetical protein LBW56_10940 [Ralstonia solanacearum]|uniref:hypothetical protein n=1 Tax=Ralstonia solanacearum TaxID=305 RepID=UPI001FF87F8A|nr:hypothetical protein [Ralstonia solanacearum]MDB0527206.1 hypothetical protein [Ralstonia solanacearum]